MSDQKDQLEYYLDQFDYDYIILGTGLNECLYSVCLAKLAKKKILVIDLDNVYSSSIRTLNLKEFNNYFTGNYDQSQQKSQIFYKIMQLNEIENNLFVQKLIEDKQFRQFNLDLQPKIIFSTSSTVDSMRQADMDKYMDFRAINGIYHYDLQKYKFILAPSSKSDIFTHQDLSLIEKKQMFNLLHTCIKLYNIYSGYLVDINSTDEFDKDFQVEEKYIKIFELYQNSNCILFINELTKSEKIKNIFLYTLCNYEFNPELQIPQFLKDQYTTINFLKRLDKFMKSCGVHTQLPYLYTNYGTGDIPQGFARIAAVFGTVFCINPKIKINNLQQKQELIQLFTNLSGQNEFVNTKGIIIGPEYIDLMKQYLLNMNKQDQQQDEVEYLLRQTIIISKEFTEQQQSDDKKAPLIFNIPPGCLQFNNEYPIWMFLTDYDTLSTPKGFAVIYMKQIISKQNKVNQEYLIQNQKNSQIFVLNTLNQVQGGLYKSQIQYHVAYIQELTNKKQYKEFILNDKNKVILLEQDNFSVDLDQNFDLFKKHITSLTEIQKDQESYFMTKEELQGIVDSNMVPIDYSEKDDISNILKDYDQLKQKQSINQQFNNEQNDIDEQSNQQQDQEENKNNQQIQDIHDQTN